MHVKKAQIQCMAVYTKEWCIDGLRTDRRRC